MRTSDVLRKVQDLLSEETSWNRGYMARDENGQAVEPTDERACSFCTLGALFRTYHELGLNPLGTAREQDAAVLNKFFRPSVVDFNDHSDYGAVMGALQDAIDLAEERER